MDRVVHQFGAGAGSVGSPQLASRLRESPEPDLVVDDDTRYLVWMAPAQFAFDKENEVGVRGPLEAIQSALELHLDGGWDWLVWDRAQRVGFRVEANPFIYEPLAALIDKMMLLDDMQSSDILNLIDEANLILEKRAEK